MSYLELNFKNNFKFFKNINVKGLRYPKIFTTDKKKYLFCSCLYNSEKNKNKYLINYFMLDDNFDIVGDSKVLDLSKIINNYFDDINISSWLRNIYNIDNEIYINLEIKYNIENSTFKHDNFFVKTSDLIDIEIIKKYDLNDHFIFYETDKKIILSSIIIKNEEFWGKYLFNFINYDNSSYRPVFDNVVNYNNDSGQVLHKIFKDKITDKFVMLFSIRHKIENYKNYSNELGYIYKLYIGYTDDFKNFYNTQELQVNINNLNTEFLSYPDIYSINNTNYIICNQDEFGKEKNLLIFKQEFE